MIVRTFFLLLVLSPSVSHAEYTTAHTARKTPTYQTPTHFEHVFGAGDVYFRPLIEPGSELGDVLVNTQVAVEEDEPEYSDEYLIWMKYCNNQVLTKEEYLVVDEGGMPADLIGKCKKKGGKAGGGETVQKAEEIERK